MSMVPEGLARNQHGLQARPGTAPLTLAPAADRTDDIVSGGTRIRRMRLCLLRCSDGRRSRAALSPSC